MSHIHTYIDSCLVMLHYKKRTDRATGELKLSQVKQVQKMNGLRFAISFNGKGTPWVLKASDEASCNNELLT